jgi:hypothetical protein
MLFLDPGLDGTSGLYNVSAQTSVESQTHDVSLNKFVLSLSVDVRLLTSYFSNHFRLVPQYISDVVLYVSITQATSKRLRLMTRKQQSD